MSKTFDYISGKTDGPIAAAEARAEYSEGMLGAVLQENERLRAALCSIAEQKLSTEIEQDADYEYGYDAIVEIARKTISNEQP